MQVNLSGNSVYKLLTRSWLLILHNSLIYEIALITATFTRYVSH